MKEGRGEAHCVAESFLESSFSRYAHQYHISIGNHCEREEDKKQVVVTCTTR